MNRAPSRDSLQKMPAVRILRTLDFGLMMGIAYPIKREEREAVEELITRAADAVLAWAIAGAATAMNRYNKL